LPFDSTHSGYWQCRTTNHYEACTPPNRLYLPTRLHGITTLAQSYSSVAFIGNIPRNFL